MLTILVKTIANTNQYFCDNTFTVYYIQQRSFFPHVSVIY